MKTNKAAVIGAGIGGIAMATRLAAKGYEVEVFEKNEGPGGKLTEFYKDGYRFDAGPSLFTMPYLVDELFTLFNEDAHQYFQYKKLDELCHYFFEDGTKYITHTNVKQTAGNMAAATNEKEENIIDFLLESKKLYDLTSDFFIFSSLNDYKKYFSFKFLKNIFQIHRLKMNRTMFDSLHDYFTDSHVIKHFSRYATYNGSDPYRAPATLNVIPNLEYYQGAYLPVNGMFDITKSLVDLGKRHGVNYHFNAEVQSILHDGKKLKGVEVNGEKHSYNLVVCNGDIHQVYHHLLKDVRKPNKIFEQELSTSALVFNWGIKSEFSELGLHNVFFPNDYKLEFDTLFNKKSIADDPSIYIFISSKFVKKDAPDGCENWFTLVNAPTQWGQNWDELIAQSRINVLSKLERILGKNIESLIETESILDPIMIESQTSSFRGALYGNSSNNKLSAFLRHSNKSHQIKNLYFVGGSVHPGGGIPLCLSSAKIVDRWIKSI